MKRQIRKSVFETNSSSTHAICISKEDVNVIKLPFSIDFTQGDFGWEFRVINDSHTKASYLYQVIFDMCYYRSPDKLQEYKNRISELLARYNIEAIFSKIDEYDGYVDHAGEAMNFVNSVLSDGDKLIRFLFGDSIIVTGSDNDDYFDDYMYVDGNENWNYELKDEFKKYEIYEKGN